MSNFYFLKFFAVFLIVVFTIISNFELIAQKKSKQVSIEDLISQMTLEEKVGQMVNLTLSTISKEKDYPITIDSEKLRDVIVKHNVGSIQNVIKHAYTLQEWGSITKRIQDITLKETRLKIPNMYCIDAVHGTNFTLGSTLFPHNLGLAATRNPDLVFKCSEVTAKEVRASGIRYNFSPVLDVGRQPLWPRFAETFGEDVFIVKTLGLASVKGYENAALNSHTAVASCMKHFIGYSVPNSGKDRAPASIPEREMREYFLPPFKAAIDAGSRTIMVNSGEVNGVPLHASKYWLTKVLREELGFKGMVISDWQDIIKLKDRHRVADSYKEAARLAVDAGIDMCIVPFDFSFYDDVISLVKEGKLSEERINESVRRILKLKSDLGLFENPYLEPMAVKNFGLKEYEDIALQAAHESVTLLKNENNFLPLDKSKKILVTGPASNSITSLHGAWSYTWQGDSAGFFSKKTITIHKALSEKIGSDKVYHENGSGFIGKPDFEKAVAAAKNVDIIIVCLGEDSYAETPGNIKDLEIPDVQVSLVNELARIGKPMVIVLAEGRPRIIRKIEPLSKSILMAYWPGSQGARAIADIIFGDYNPDGKLPFTYPRYSGELLTYDHKYLDEAVEVAEPYKYTYEFNPQYHFGHGLSFTSFEYSNLTLSDTIITEKPITITITVKNSGQRAGKETVELYTRDLFASITPAVKQLKGFTKIELNPGESKRVEFTIHKEDLAFIKEDLNQVTEPGGFEVMVGSLKAGLTVK